MKKLVGFLLVLSVLFIAADFGLKASAESAATEAIDENVTRSRGTEVDLGGFPFLPSLFAGSFDRMQIDIASAWERDLLVEDIQLTLRDVELDPFEFVGGGGSVRARSLQGSGVIAEATINEVLAAERDGLDVEVENGRVMISQGEFSAPANAVVAGNRLLISAGEVVGPLEIPLPLLARGIRFNSLRAERNRLVLGADASRVTIRI